MGGGGKGGGGSQSKAAIKAAEIAAGSQRDALDYLKEQERLPSQIREGALTQLQSIYGLGDNGQQGRADFIEGIKGDPLYQAQLAGQDEALLRNRASAGSLRGGGTLSALGNVQNQALLNAYGQKVGGIQSLAGLPSNANQIAQLGSQIGETQAAGITGAAAARAQGQQNQAGNLLGLGQLGILGYGAYSLSDPRLKKDITFVKKINGVKIYKWLWNDLAEKVFNIKGESQGVLTTEHPECCDMHQETGYMMVNVEKIMNKVGSYD